MRSRILLVLVVVVLLTGSAFAQQCGNVNGTGIIDIGDLSYLVAHLMYSYGPPATPTMDLDGGFGVALADIIELTDYLARTNSTVDSFDCTPEYSYTFATSPDDTVFIPRLLVVPDGIDLVGLPVRISLRDNAGGSMFFLRESGATSGFRIDNVVEHSSFNVNPSGISRDDGWGFLVVRFGSDEAIVGNHHYFTVTCRREVSGSTGGSIELEPYDVDALRRLCIERDGDLFIPTVVYYDYVLPPDTLEISTTSLAFTTAAGRKAKDTLSVTFTSTSSLVTFDLTANVPWITLLDVSGTLTTPVTVKVAVDGATLEEGSYAGELTLTNITSPVGVITPQTSVAVSVAVGPPINYPPGDLNCSGVVDGSDLAWLVAYLTNPTGQKPIIEPCY